MANIKISLGSDRNLNKNNVYSDIDVSSDYIESTLKDRLSIENSLTNILTWKPRERILNPSFGNTLWKRIFDNFTSFSKADIENEVSNMLSREPRIKVESISVSPEIDNSAINVSFTYSIPSLEHFGKNKTLHNFSLKVKSV